MDTAKRSGLDPVGEAVLRANRRLGGLERILWRGRPDRIRRLGVLREGMLGDVAVALSALSLLEQALPQSELFLLSSPGPRGAPGAAELLPPHSRWQTLVWHREDLGSPLGKARLWKALWGLRLDAVLVLPAARSSFRRQLGHGLALWAARVGWARGLGITRGAYPRPAGIDPTSPLPKQLPQARRLEGLTRQFLEECQIPHRHLWADPRALLAVGAEAANADALAPLDGEADRPLLLLAPGAKGEIKRWAPERFAEVARRWNAAGGRSLVLGSDGERALGQRVAQGSGATDLVGQLTVRESLEVMARGAALVSNDSGPAHLAAALGLPTVVVQAARDLPGAWDPAGPGPVRVLRFDPPCAPCFAERCDRGQLCLEALDAAQVLSALAAIARPFPNRERARRRPGLVHEAQGARDR